MINRDRSLRLQYVAGLALDRQDGYLVSGAIIDYRRYPTELFDVFPADEAVLRRSYEVARSSMRLRLAQRPFALKLADHIQDDRP